MKDQDFKTQMKHVFMPRYFNTDENNLIETVLKEY